MKHSPPIIYRAAVVPEWIDYNGHMNVAYYVLAFDRCTDAFFDKIGLTPSYIEQTQHSMFVAELHVTYLQELHQGDQLEVSTQLLGHDQKRLHFFHRMFRRDTGELVATHEALGLHVSLETRKVIPMQTQLFYQIASHATHHKQYPWPPEAGHQMGIPLRKN